MIKVIKQHLLLLILKFGVSSSVRACVRACVRARVCVCVCVCVQGPLFLLVFSKPDSFTSFKTH